MVWRVKRQKISAGSKLAEALDAFHVTLFLACALKDEFIKNDSNDNNSIIVAGTIALPEIIRTDHVLSKHENMLGITQKIMYNKS